MNAQYTIHVGEKFLMGGQVRPYPGVTIICFAPLASTIYKAGVLVQDQLQQQPYGSKFVLLPPSSFHMTVFSLILDQQRIPEYWTSHLSLDTPLETVDTFLIEQVGRVVPPKNLRLCTTYVGGQGLSFRLSPADESTYEAIWDYRARVAAATGIRYPDHDSYQFHLTLAYNLVTLSPQESVMFSDWRFSLGEKLRGEIGIFDTGEPTLTFFDDMFAFVPADQRRSLESRMAAG
jgi:hypothetical protein